jgi:MFS family permease
MMDFNTSGHTEWGRVLLIFSAGVVVAFQVGKAPPVLPLLRTELGLTLFLAGWVLSALNVVGALISSGAGAISDWLGHRRLILLGLACQTFGSLSGAFSQTAYMLLATRFLEGLGYILAVVAAPALILRITRPENVRLAFGVWGSFMPFGSALMMVASPFLVQISGWRGLWLINGGLLLAITIWLALGTRDLGGPKSKGSYPFGRLIDDIWLTMRTPGPFLLALCFGAYAFQWLVVIGFLPTLLVEQHHLSQTMAAALGAAVIAINVPGNLMGGWLLQREIKRWGLLALASTVMGLCCFGIFHSSLPLSMRYVFCLAFSGIGGMLPAATLHGAAVLAPTRKLVATSNGLLMQGAQLGLLTGPPLVAAAVSRAGAWHVAPWILVIPALIGIFLSVALKRVEEGKIES